MQTSGERKCSNRDCSREGELQCARCKTEFYCSQPCQKKSWRIHKLSCSKSGTEKQMRSKAVGVCENKECSKPGNLRCSRCKTAGYCSAECQKKAWKQHKVSCKQPDPSGQDRAPGQNPSSSGSSSTRCPDVNPNGQMPDDFIRRSFIRPFL